jgi:Sigma-70 region 2
MLRAKRCRHCGGELGADDTRARRSICPQCRPDVVTTEDIERTYLACVGKAQRVARYIAGAADADDVVQATVLRLLRNRASLRQVNPILFMIDVKQIAWDHVYAPWRRRYTPMSGEQLEILERLQERARRGGVTRDVVRLPEASE